MIEISRLFINGFHQTGGFMEKKELSQSLEDYLEAILILETKNKVARITDIANLLKIKKSSVSKALKLLAEKELINYHPYKFITLQPKGLIFAQRILNKHKTLKFFCKNILSLDEKDSDFIACEMEHFISCKNIQHFQSLIDFFKENPKAAEAWENKKNMIFK